MSMFFLYLLYTLQQKNVFLVILTININYKIIIYMRILPIIFFRFLCYNSEYI